MTPYEEIQAQTEVLDVCFVAAYGTEYEKWPMAALREYAEHLILSEVMAVDPDVPKKAGLLSREEVDELLEQIKEGRESPEVRAEIDREFDRATGKVWGVERALSRGKLSGQQKALVDKHVDKYMAMLKVEGERPDVRVADDRERIFRDGREGYVAGSTNWHPIRPYTSLIRFQKTLFKRPLTLENTIAHELVHHRNNLAITDAEIKNWLETGRPPAWWAENDGHGKAFQEGADRINAIMGPGYISEEGATEKEEEEEAQLSKAERQRRAKNVNIAMQLLLGLGGGVLAILTLRKMSSPARNPPPSPSRSPHVAPETQSFPDRGKVPPLLATRQTNERGRYGTPKIESFSNTNERGSYGPAKPPRSPP